MDKKNIPEPDGNTIRQEGYSVEQSIMIGAANYVISRQFSDGSRKKQDLLRTMITQKLAEQDRLPAKENLNYNSLCELAPKGDYE